MDQHLSGYQLMATIAPESSEDLTIDQNSKRMNANLHDSNRSYRRRSPPSRGQKERHHRPNNQGVNHRSSDRYRPDYGRHTQRQRQRSASPGRAHHTNSKTESNNKKSTKDRKANPSTRIRSLKNLLERGNLPATVKQEKERELAGLLFDQQKQVIKEAGKKNLKRYHFIRFVERQKASRMLKQLKKAQASGDVSEDLEKRIHECEVDLNYTTYAPLAQKYISIYAREDSIPGKPRPLARNLSRMHKQDYAMLSEEQQYEIEQACMEAADMMQVIDPTSGLKPPMWYIVEEKMKGGQKALDNLRDEQLSMDHLKSELVIGVGAKKTPDWLDDDGKINAEDLDSESDGENKGGATIDAVSEDEEMSDGDGGFFEKR